jgi:hypothetical protein
MSFIVETGKGGKGKTAERQRERERGRECEHWEAVTLASVVHRPLENTYVKINKMVFIWTD